MRPTFEAHLPYPKTDFVHRVVEELSKPRWASNSLVFDDYIELHIDRSELRFWSPHLSLYIEGDGSHTLVTGRFGPRQEVWTLVCVLYMLLAFTAFFALIYAYVQWTLGQSAWTLLPGVASLLGVGAIHLASYVGQNWSSDQIHRLRGDWQQLVDEATEPLDEEE